MVEWILKFTKIFWKMNVLISLLEHLEGYWHCQEIKTYPWRMSGILSWMSVTRCSSHLVYLLLIIICSSKFYGILNFILHDFKFYIFSPSSWSFYFSCAIFLNTCIFWYFFLLCPLHVFCRYAEGCTGDLQDDSSWQTSYDVFCNTQQRNPPSLQEVYARCNFRQLVNLEFRSFFPLNYAFS